MRPNNQNKRNNRGRNSGNRNRHNNGGNPLTRNYESNGPDVKIRGNAAHIVEKYVQLARDAQNASDSVAEQNYLQHAEHYLRIVTAANAQNLQRQQERQQAEAALAAKAAEEAAANPAPEVKVENSEIKDENAKEAVSENEEAPKKPRVRRPRRQPRIKENEPVIARESVVASEMVKEEKTDKMPQSETDGLPAFLAGKENTDAAQ